MRRHRSCSGLSRKIRVIRIRYRVLAACYAHWGRLDEARAVIARLRSITPRLVPSASQLRSPADRELFLSGLCEAVGEPG